MKAVSAAAKSIDPVCGMQVDPASAAGSFEHEGRMYYFCSKSYLNKFQQAPDSFAEGETEKEKESASKGLAESNVYTCPMHPDVRQTGPGSCPKCGMALEPLRVEVPKEKVEYTCPMHPEIVRDKPGNCPICGMALEPRTVTATEDNAELSDMKRRFWTSVALTIPLLVIAMGKMAGLHFEQFASPSTWGWVELLLASPVVLWGGWPFFVRGWQSILNRSLNMFTLIGLGVGVAYVYSLIAALMSDIFPASFRDMGGRVPVYFEPAAVIVTLVLLGQVLELKARSQTGAAIRGLLGLAPKTARPYPRGREGRGCLPR
jgi:Cu+-exporting ATPase